MGAMNDTDQTRDDAGTSLCLIGFGEAAQAFVAGWAGAGCAVGQRAYDLKTDMEADTAAAKRADYARAGVAGSATPQEAVAGADAVLSLVTADAALAAAESVAAHMPPGALFFDGNSCAPSTKQASAALIEATGGRYVDMAIMAPVHPRLHRVPVLLSGPHAETGAAFLRALDMVPRVEPGPVGRASSIKMIRSIMVKGLEALMAECLLAGRQAGVEDAVIASLDASYPGLGWEARAAYNLERMMVHGPRRAAEMKEVARTVCDLGLPGTMAAATAGWEQLIGDLALEPGGNDARARADRILAALTPSDDKQTKNRG